MPKKLRKRRKSLWQQFEKKCFWCGVETVFPEAGTDNEPKVDNLATVEHVRSKYRLTPCPDCGGTGVGLKTLTSCKACAGRGEVKDRYEPNHSNEQRLVLACLRCNGLRSSLEVKMMTGIRIKVRVPVHTRI